MLPCHFSATTLFRQRANTWNFFAGHATKAKCVYQYKLNLEFRLPALALAACLCVVSGRVVSGRAGCIDGATLSNQVMKGFA